MTDLNSIYEQNIADVGVGVTIMRSSDYNGKEITFDDNEAYSLGGAVLATI